MNKHKVLHVIDNLTPGGAQRVVRGILEARVDQSNYSLLSLRRKEREMEITHSNVFISKATGKFSLSPLFELKKIVHLKKIDIVHCHLFKSCVFGFLLKIFWFPDLKLVLHEHGGIIEDGIVYKIFFRIAQGKADLIIAVSRAMKDALVQGAKVDNGKIKILYNFVDLKKFNPSRITKMEIIDFRNKNGIEKGAFVVGFASRIYERKGWRDFLTAVSILKKKGIVFKTVIAGDGPEKDLLLRTIDDFGLRDTVRYLGYQSDMLTYYASLDTFVMASYWEGLPMTQLEVLAMGVPLITTNGPGMDEVIFDGESGILCPIKSPETLASAIERLKDDDGLRVSLAQKGCVLAAQYSLDFFMIHLEEMYQIL